MSDSLSALRKKISRAQDLHAVVRTMKAAAASSIGQFEQALHALSIYVVSLELGLSRCFIDTNHDQSPLRTNSTTMDALIIGSDQGLVGQFNDCIVDYAIKELRQHYQTANIWVIGERALTRLEHQNIAIAKYYPVPSSLKMITPFINALLIDFDAYGILTNSNNKLVIFFNKLESSSFYTQTKAELLPFDSAWLLHLQSIKWPAKNLPEVFSSLPVSRQKLLQEYVFVSLYNACIASLASENMSRMMAMLRAEKNISELIDILRNRFHRLRKESIDAELFDVIAGFESLLH
jgi:F-type H+-transporting ATPase subunit gamma